MKSHKLLKAVLFFLGIGLFCLVKANVALDQIHAILDHKTKSAEKNTSSISPQVLSTTSKKLSWSDFNRAYSVVAFFSSRCPHCQRFMPILRSWQQDNGTTLLSYSINGEGLPSFPRPLEATDEVKQTFFRSQEIVVPALFVVNNQTMDILPIAVGEMSKEELVQQMNKVKLVLLGGPHEN